MKTQLAAICIFLSFNVFAGAGNDSLAWQPDVGFDFTSRYVWRGSALSNSPNLQPYLGIGYKNFGFGAWGSYATDGNYAEIDLWVSYSIAGLNITLNDYYTEDETDYDAFYAFDYKANTTNHALELMLDYQLPIEKVPLKLTAATIFFGNDKNTNGDNNYSTYFQIAYPFEIKSYTFDLFVGATPHTSMYNGNGANVVETGIQIARDVKLSEHFTLPLSATLLANPAQENIFLIMTIGIN